MHHLGSTSKTSLNKPFHAQCSCGIAGDFATEAESKEWLAAHFAGLKGINTSAMEKVSESAAPAKPASTKGV